jgi:transposase-like protein
MARVDGLTARGREMLTLVAAWERSGQTMQQFAAAHGMTAHTFGWWRSELKRRKRMAPASAEKAIRLVEIERAGGSEKSFEVRLGNGIVVRVPLGFDGRALTELMTVLRSC